MVMLHDNDGASYDMTPTEAAIALKSGGYYMADGSTEQAKPAPPQGSSGWLTVYDTNGVEHIMHAVDAVDAVKHSGYTYARLNAAPEKPVVSEPVVHTPTPAEVSVIEPETPVAVESPVEMSNSLPVLDHTHTNEQIMTILREHNIIFRTNSNKDVLLGLWQDYLREQA